MNRYGAVKFGENPKYFTWDDKQLLKATNHPSEELQHLLQRSRAHYAAMAYFIRNETKKK
jgi:hypothetical protein